MTLQNAKAGFIYFKKIEKMKPKLSGITITIIDKTGTQKILSNWYFYSHLYNSGLCFEIGN